MSLKTLPTNLNQMYYLTVCVNGKTVRLRRNRNLADLLAMCAMLQRKALEGVFYDVVDSNAVSQTKDASAFNILK